MRDILRTPSNYRTLSLRDLLDARDNYHYHLLNKPNVIGTAVGLYLIRKEDPVEPVTREAQLRAKAVEKRAYQPRPRRTFANSEVRSYSWPCVLALVDQWEDEANFGAGRQLEPQDIVPKTLYLPDGRMVPVCVVQVEPAEPEQIRIHDARWPHTLFGPGMPIFSGHQHIQRRATVGCLVSDGHTTYALTSRHASGDFGEVLETLSGGRRVRVGRAHRKQLTRELFETLYPEFRAQRTYVNLDVGLVELDDLTDWTSRTYGLGSTGAMADLNAMNITTRLIDAPVVACGAATGRLEGRIKGLFYRYRSVGGYDYISDLLIAPRDLGADAVSPQTQPGDSGAVWHLVVQKETAGNGAAPIDEYDGEFRPLAVEWGGQTFVGDQGSGRFAFALATTLTNVCRSLDVELITDDRTGVSPFWGRFGHYSIAAVAIEALPDGDLKRFMEKNLDRITFDHFDAKQMTEYLKTAKEKDDFVPLADVPDEVWKKFKTNPGGRDIRSAGNGRTTGPEHPTHYADVDIPDAGGVTLLQHSLDPAKLTVTFWQRFYNALGMAESRDRGLLPFRVWQFFTAMRGFAAAGDATSFLCAAGLLAHYVGDACQPLHGSQYSDGYGDQPVTITHHRRETGEEYTESSHVGAGVHSAYETKMLDRFAPEIATGMQTAVRTITGALPTTGAEAAMAIVQLMDRSAIAIAPSDLVDGYVAAGGKPGVAVLDRLWNDFGDSTIGVMTDGAATLARIWAGAWQGHVIPAGQMNAIPFDDLRALYEDVDFIASKDLDLDPRLLAPTVAAER